MSPSGTTTTHPYSAIHTHAAATASLLHLVASETAGLAIAIARSPDCAYRHTDFAMPMNMIAIQHCISV